MLVILILAVLKRSTGLYLFSGFCGIGFLYYINTNYDLAANNDSLMWLISIITLGSLLMGFFTRYK